MTQIKATVAGALVWALSAAPALAHEHFYEVVLAAPAGSGSSATGSALVTLDLDLVTARVEATFSGLSGTTLGTFLHCCTAAPGAGAAMPATALGTPPGFPTGLSAGSFDITYDLTEGATYNPLFITASGGAVVDGLNALVNGAEAGTVYLSLLTTAFPGGELVGFLVERQPVPEPGTWGLMFAGLAAVGWAARRRQAG